jgi:hypothetical protein
VLVVFRTSAAAEIEFLRTFACCLLFLDAVKYTGKTKDEKQVWRSIWRSLATSYHSMGNITLFIWLKWFARAI